MNLSDEKLKEINKLKKDIQKLANEAHRNMNSDKTKVQVSLQELKGLPEPNRKFYNFYFY